MVQRSAIASCPFSITSPLIWCANFSKIVQAAQFKNGSCIKPTKNPSLSATHLPFHGPWPGSERRRASQRDVPWSLAMGKDAVKIRYQNYQRSTCQKQIPKTRLPAIVKWHGINPRQSWPCQYTSPFCNISRKARSILCGTSSLRFIRHHSNHANRMKCTGRCSCHSGLAHLIAMCM